jgi:septum formation protein
MELLKRAGWDVEVIPSDAEELHDVNADVAWLCRENAARKARDIAAAHPGAWVIGADTLVSLQKTIMGKPKDLEDSKAMLRSLSGEVNQVCTGVCLIDPSGKEHLIHELSEVVFRDLSDDEIEEYTSLVNTLDKAGAYAVQEHGEKIISEVRGDLDNIIGLPVKKLLEMAKQFQSDF